MKPSKPPIPVWLIILYVLSLLTILIWPFIAFMSVFAFDAPGSSNDPAVWTAVIAVLSYPVLPLIGIPGSFLFYRASRKVPAYVLAGIGAIPLALLIVVLIAMVVENVLFAVGSKF
jgi:hypothetical protein